MSREPHIPLFLWIATAIVAHAIWGGGAHQVSKALEETLDIGAFAREVQRHVRLHSVPVEVSLLDEQDAPSLEVPSQVDPAQESTEEADPQESTEVDPEEERVEEKKREEEKKKEKEPERPQAPEPEPDPEPTPEQDQPQLVVPPEALNRVAVEQHVEDKDQEDNPDAAHIAELRRNGQEGQLPRGILDTPEDREREYNLKESYKHHSDHSSHGTPATEDTEEAEGTEGTEPAQSEATQDTEETESEPANDAPATPAANATPSSGEAGNSSEGTS